MKVIMRMVKMVVIKPSTMMVATVMRMLTLAVVTTTATGPTMVLWIGW